jgi:hypothetical protein
MIDTIIHNREITAYIYDLKGNLISAINTGKNNSELIFAENKIKEVKSNSGIFSFNYTEGKKAASVKIPQGRLVQFPIDQSETEVLSRIKEWFVILEQADLGYYLNPWATNK